jgi:hypothetical protein
MKNDLDPRVAIGILAVIVAIAAGGIYLGTRGQGNHSGPVVEAKYQGGRAMGGGGWHPGMAQPRAGKPVPVPGSQDANKPKTTAGN